MLHKAPIENLATKEVPLLDHTAVYAFHGISLNRDKSDVVSLFRVDLSFGLGLIVIVLVFALSNKMNISTWERMRRVNAVFANYR